MIEVNLIATFKITLTFIPLLKKYNANNTIKARVINIASWPQYSARFVQGSPWTRKIPASAGEVDRKMRGCCEKNTT